MQLGIVGLPNVGKSTLFNAITQAGAEAANYPYCTIEPNVGVVSVPDARLDRLAEMYHPEKYSPAIVEFVDIAGLIAGASKGEGLGNKFLANIREVDAIVHVVRCFEDSQVIHVESSTNAERDIETVNIELMLADMEYLEKRREKLHKQLKGDKSLQLELHVCEKYLKTLGDGKSARTVDLDEAEKEAARHLSLLSAKPVLYIGNVSEAEAASAEDNPHYQAVKRIAQAEGAEALSISAKIEEEIAALDPEEKAMFLEELGLKQSGLDRIILAGYKLLGLISFLTAGPKEVRAWTITKGTKAPQAAGKIHSDFEKGFIRAEVVAYTDLMSCGSMHAAKEKGLVRSEGKEYVFQDGDVVLFRFNV